ncbi:MAG: hypothetical protein PVH88_26845 [Ignavibacteria bacterium]|jgi:ABC-type phosphate transport system substrate-binding protein
MRKFLLIISLIILTSIYSKAQIAVIANKSVPEKSISKSELLDLYSGDIKWWDNGEPVIIFDLKKNDDIKSDFYSFIGKTPSRMKTIWMKKMLSGEGDPPDALDSEKEMLHFVSNTKGAIGFISLTKIDSSVKIIAIINN